MGDDRYTLRRWIPEFCHQVTEREFRQARTDTDRVSALLYLTIICLLFFAGHSSDLRNFDRGGGEIEVLRALRLLPAIFIGILAVLNWRTRRPKIVTASIAIAVIAISGAYLAIGVYTQTHGAQTKLHIFFPLWCLFAALISPSSFKAGVAFAFSVTLFAVPGALLTGVTDAAMLAMSWQLVLALIGGMIIQAVLQRNHRRLYAKLREAEDRRRRVSQQLDEAERLGAIGLLAANVAHDLNNFLTPVVTATDMLHTELEGDKPLQALARQASEAADRAKELVWRLLESARSPPAKNRVCVRDVVKTLRERLRDAVGNGALELELPDADIHVFAAPQALERVLVNLVVNAGEAIAEKGGHVEVRFERICHEHDSTPQVRIRVRDNGEGIDPAILERLFDPLVTTKEAGHGLGLASVRRIVEEHDGSINACNLEQGAVFEVIWPMAPDVTDESSLSSS